MAKSTRTPRRAPRERTSAPTAAAPSDADTESRILDAAHSVFLRHGTAGARMQEIAREAGVNQALLHYYFRSKKGLADAVFRRAVMTIIPPVIQLLGSETPLPDKLERAVHLYLDNLSRTPILPGYLLAELNHHPERAHQLFRAMTGLDRNEFAPRVLSRLRAQIAEQVRAGTMRPTRAEDLVITIASLCLFPFAARPMLTAILGMDDDEFDRLIKRRRADLPGFLLRGFRP